MHTLHNEKDIEKRISKLCALLSEACKELIALEEVIYPDAAQCIKETEQKGIGILQ